VASLTAQGAAVTVYYVTRPTPKPALTIRLGDAAASWSLDVATSKDAGTGLIVRTSQDKPGRQARTFDIKVRTDNGIFAARSGERVALPNRDQAVQVMVNEPSGATWTKTLRLKAGQLTDASVEFTPSRGQVLVTKVGDSAPLLR